MFAHPTHWRLWTETFSSFNFGPSFMAPASRSTVYVVDGGPPSLPTSHVEVGGGRVAGAVAVGSDALILPLVGLFAVLDLEGT